MFDVVANASSDDPNSFTEEWNCWTFPPPLAASYERPDKGEIARKHASRFAK